MGTARTLNLTELGWVPVRQLTRKSLNHCVQLLCHTDRDLAGVVARAGPPPLWGRRPGYATLVRIILEQQVSLASANAVYARLRSRVQDVTAESVAAIGPSGLRDCGFTRQKALYCVEIAHQLLAGRFDLRDVTRTDDHQARQALITLKGVGPWTADIYLLMALRRPDIWPVGDLALAEATRRLKRLRARPTHDRLARIASAWKPFRSVAARILWQFYLQRPGSPT